MNLAIMIALVGVLVAIVVPVYVYRRQRRFRELSYEKIGTISLFNIEEVVALGSTIRHRVEVRVDEEPVERLDTFIVVLRSTGTLSVEYEQQNAGAQTPVTLDFGEGAQIVSVESRDERRASAIVDLDNPNKVIVDRLLLNPDESALISVFLVQFDGKVEVSGHLRDTRIQERKRERNERLPLLFAVAGMVPSLAFALMAFAIGLGFAEGDIQLSLFVLGAFLLFLSIGCLLVAQTAVERRYSLGR